MRTKSWGNGRTEFKGTEFEPEERKAKVVDEGCMIIERGNMIVEKEKEDKDCILVGKTPSL